MYDIIGDIHGQVEKLEGLLAHLGYEKTDLGYTAPLGRKAVFLGDLIDRGHGQLGVLNIVRTMVDTGDALCIAGNHEVNAVGFATKDPNNAGHYLRPRSDKNRKQHAAFLDAVVEDSAEHHHWIAWFKTLPIALDLDGIRVVHADWDDVHVKLLNTIFWNKDRSSWSDEFLYGTYVKDSALMHARKMLTCGLEIDLPEGGFIEDKEGHKHYEVRVARWRHYAKRLHEVALVPKGQEKNVPDLALEGFIELNEPAGAPVFIGHHWFSGQPLIESPKLACLDWSAAKDGPLVAYCWDGETELSNEKLMWVDVE
jgi:hypothetical protein